MKQLLGSFWAGLAWAFGYACVAVIGEGLSAVSTYAVITGWWFAAFVSSKLKLGLGTVAPLMGLYYLSFLACTFAGIDWFYRDVADASVQRIFVVGLLQSAVIASPVIFNRISDSVSTMLKCPPQR